jgi:hypothetical protein
MTRRRRSGPDAALGGLERMIAEHLVEWNSAHVETVGQLSALDPVSGQLFVGEDTTNGARR